MNNMSLKSIIKDVDGFFSKLFSKTMDAQKVLATAGALAPLIEAGLAFSGDPQPAQVVQAAFTEAQTDLATFQAIVKQSDLVSSSCQERTPHARARRARLAEEGSGSGKGRGNFSASGSISEGHIVVAVSAPNGRGNAFSLPSLDT
jgi:hypothetical protein